ncbi:HU family DNA-binding protein [Methylobacterium platani]|uniref:Viral histone-like protein n=2 Tax=Methylobacterium platani TaxID=427683 RepID=A0A179SH21_9HYPH|nr:HU family DNA-binding protein [Methylobacterium platani]KMO21411.1 hypothetical protein SQ03_03420 [Methylobacterium platani JCM 14648]OAS26310.1 hypothetical protein A5481_06235 [Methylobacterium platani]
MKGPEFTRRLSELSGVAIGDVEAVLQAQGDIIESAVRQGDEVYLPEVGKMQVRDRFEPTTRHRGTGELIPSHARKSLRFKPLKRLRDAVRAFEGA